MRWPSTLQQLGVSAGLINALHVGGGDPFGAIKRAVACLLLMTRNPMADIERNLLQHTRDRSAAGNIRGVASRTRDVIDAVVQVALLQGRTVSASLATDDLGLQLELGLPVEGLALARLLGAEIGRGDYLALLNAGVVDEVQLRKLNEGALDAIVGPLVAARIRRVLVDEE